MLIVAQEHLGRGHGRPFQNGVHLDSVQLPLGELAAIELIPRDVAVQAPTCLLELIEERRIEHHASCTDNLDTAMGSRPDISASASRALIHEPQPEVQLV